MRESSEGVSAAVLGVAVLGVVGAGATAALRLGAWGAGGAWGGVLGRRWRWADGDDVRTAFAVRGGARRQLCEVRQHRGRRHRGGSCVARAARVFHVKHDVYRVAGG